ncbi:choice-of-anchor L domain-containing protein, partial [uncultured Flavobacterium sp.]|uniref:choice-of-anchor L domain-containing protein n=1 Tax=uncultured Flavobacterium sp. TaxID=165435 RepID=UPI0030CA418D
EVYYIRVYSATAVPLQTTTFNVCVSVPPPPPSNDSCATPLIAQVNQGNSCTLFVPGTITSATASPEPNTCGGTDDDDVWFQFTATNSTHIISLNNIIGTTTDLNFALYSGATCGALTEVACNLPNTGTIAGLAPGTLYLIRVYSATATIGQYSNFDLCIGSPPVSLDNTTYTVQQLITDVLIDSPCAQVTNITWKTGNTNNFGSTDGIAYFQENAPGILPFPNGLVMTSGNAMRSSGPNNSNLSDGNAAWTGDADLEAIILAATGQTMNSRNATVIEFDFIPLTPTISFDFMFASEEYGTFQCAYSDSFAFLLTDVVASTTTNLAIIPTTVTPISVVTVRDALYNTGCTSVNSEYFDVYNGGANIPTAATNYNGQTVQFTASSTVTPLSQYHIKMVIADRGDNAYDSAVFLKAGSFDIGNVDLGDDFLQATNTALCFGENYIISSGLDPALYTFTWSDLNGIIAGETGANYTATSQGEYFITAQYTGTTCQATDSLIIEYYNEIIIGAPNDLFICDTSGYGTFDLTQNNSNVLNGLNPSDYNVNFYLTQSFSDAGIFEITNPSAYSNEVQNLQTIYVRVENINEGCFKLEEFNLVIQDLTPQFTITPDFNICENATGTILITPIDFIDSDVTYSWTLDSAPLPDTTGSISVTQGGTYTVVVDRNGCSTSMSTVVTITTSPVSDVLSDQVLCDSSPYVLPVLSLGNSYYTGSNATGSMLNAGDAISSTQMLYIFSGTAPNCFDESSFTVTIVATPVVATPSDVSSCDSYVLPVLSSGNSYYTGSNATGSMLNAGDVISSTQMLYVYAQSGSSPNCTAESSFTITIVATPVSDVLSDQVRCAFDFYTLPVLSSGNSYYTGSNATGSMLNAGDAISSTQMLYVYAQSGSSPNCTDESSFMVTYVDLPVVSLTGECTNNDYTITATINSTESVTYQWSNSSGVIPGASGATLVVTQDGNYSCTVSLSSSLGCSSEVEVFAADGTLCTIQKGISPNNDGLNDHFNLIGLNVKQLSIYNRYGLKVYNYANYTNQWHGQTNKGDELPTGTYYFVIERDNVEAKSGWIYINRDK